MQSARSRDVDVAIVGGGHNALVAAAYLARAGYRVAVLERLEHVGGAAVSERPWTGVDARVSRYSYLVSLLPRRIIDDLGLDVRLRRRRISSYTPDPDAPEHGLLVDTADPTATAESFARATGDEREAGRFAAFYERLAPLARTLFPTMTEPLPRAADVRAAVGDDALWSAVVEQPLGVHLRASLRTELARGVALTDALIGTFATADDPSLRQNRCFLYHVIGGGTGDWDVPIGGMGQVSGALRDAALCAGAELVTGAEVTAVSPDGEVSIGDGESVVRARLVLSGVGEAVLKRLMDAAGTGSSADAAAAPEGAQLKVNMLLSRLPRLRDTSVDAAAAFSGTFHINETMTQLDRAHDDATAGRVPSPLPAEVYCHSLTDPSILGGALRASGAQTLTLFGLQVPHRLIAGAAPDARRAELLAAAEASLDSVLAEPLRDVLFRAPDGEPCLEARTTLDLERSLGMVGGDIFHGGLDWPWAGDDEPLDSPARAWGVATAHERVLLCGSSARRGGAVSGIGGHNAAMAALALLAR
ncbi:NAD(P)/FAD-dependent oxidoreductase [Microbacterium sp. NEAU-LLC]|uniref:NAD(P)/FAD-dependent oxidoreductase n=1 Tax=Microbacterium helvum TaxID=2773713 RepID=A0ABR8NHW9_9MICO|nr:NAD(P)/FAD-dependent oxidoreductase [Microbacterium helvum]MBD3940299.1 NAD(P)/FAD-dependent oxidoreductase [Microbacterium helvum]